MRTWSGGQARKCCGKHKSSRPLLRLPPVKSPVLEDRECRWQVCKQSDAHQQLKASAPAVRRASGVGLVKAGGPSASAYSSHTCSST
mmetsp:Transcript_2296/g.4234  ORF Transcript_2296/g.4234 Transcript_2296/m.4234 type:complete len:87 (-) Transcript_2296:335-595(-)